MMSQVSSIIEDVESTCLHSSQIAPIFKPELYSRIVILSDSAQVDPPHPIYVFHLSTFPYPSYLIRRRKRSS